LTAEQDTDDEGGIRIYLQEFDPEWHTIEGVISILTYFVSNNSLKKVNGLSFYANSKYGIL
jgi:hypothetical protein